MRLLEEERERIYSALEKYDSHSQYFLPEEDLNRVNYLLSCLCDFLKADVESVRLGHWVRGIVEMVDDDLIGGSFPFQHWNCSECGYDTKGLKSKYCLECGAKMENGRSYRK